MSTSSTPCIHLLRWGACATWPLVFALGCSSSDFTVAGTVDDASVDDTGSETSVSVDSALDSSVDDAVDDTRPRTDSTVGDARADTTISVDGGGVDAVVVGDAVGVDSGPGSTDAGGPFDAGPDVGMPCTANGQCGTNAFCNRVGCGAATTGTCKPMDSIATYGPVCGCDGLTYWNSFQAASFSVAIGYGGLCKEGDRKTCTVAGACPTFSGSECIFEVPDNLSCTLGAGACWRNPAGQICPPGLSGPAAKTCGGVCITRCQGVANANKFYLEPACPGG